MAVRNNGAKSNVVMANLLLEQGHFSGPPVWAGPLRLPEPAGAFRTQQKLACDAVLSRCSGRREALPGTGYFFIPNPANFLLNFATWPPLSIMRCCPVQAGCDFGSISRR